MSKVKYNRIVLKLSGEALAGEKGFGINPPVIKKIAEEIKQVCDLRSRLHRLRRGQHVARRYRRTNGNGTCSG